MKHLLCLLLVLLVIGGNAGSILAAYTESDGKGYEFAPEDITLADDAFHGRGKLPFTEWWYFQAMFDNGYSALMSVRVVSGLLDLVCIRLDIYNNSMVLSHQKRWYPLRDVVLSSERPFIQVQGHTLMSGSYDDSTQTFTFVVNVTFPESAAQLCFVGTTTGWKGELPGGEWWVVSLPNADVTGALRVHNTVVNVTGVGYHDHDWNFRRKTGATRGWQWGTCCTQQYTVVWANMLSTLAASQPILVVSTRDAGYVSIPSESIWFNPQDIHLNHRRFIPYFFTLGAMTDDVFLIVDLEAVSVQHEQFLGLIQYWRYHARGFGTVMVEGHAETVDGVFVAEYLRFR
ncbi:MAG: hypothetical protein JXA00_05420 [Candidatus Thermoplasmatota archaeon]|nr:hypothetical protein [Candidatus Thermoplasmatota archaeon]